MILYLFIPRSHAHPNSFICSWMPLHKQLHLYKVGKSCCSSNLVVFYTDGAGGKKSIRMREKKGKGTEKQTLGRKSPNIQHFPHLSHPLPSLPQSISFPKHKGLFISDLWFFFVLQFFQALERDNLPVDCDILWKIHFSLVYSSC